MIDILVTGGVGLTSTIISSITTWILARKKYNSEVDNNLINNMKASLDFYEKLSTDNRERLEEVLKRNTKLEKEIGELRKQVFEVMTKICLNLECAVRVRNPELFGDGKQ